MRSKRLMMQHGAHHALVMPYPASWGAPCTSNASSLIMVRTMQSFCLILQHGAHHALWPRACPEGMQHQMHHAPCTTCGQAQAGRLTFCLLRFVLIKMYSHPFGCFLRKKCMPVDANALAVADDHHAPFMRRNKWGVKQLCLTSTNRKAHLFGISAGHRQQPQGATATAQK